MRRLIGIAFVLALLIAGGSIVARAQGSPLQYGDVVEGEITNDAYEVEYTFTGSADDLVVIRMWTEGFDNVLNEPALALASADNTVIGSTADHISISEAALVAILPADGEYKILATRVDGSAGDSVGTYKLSVIQPELIPAGQPVSGAITSEDRLYYVVVSSGPFTLRYERTSGTFAPEVSLNVVDETGDTESQASLSGSIVTAGTLEVDPGGEPLFLVILQESLWDFNFDVVSAEFTLTMEAAQ
ncbi:MAG: hypothetical protein IT323_07990 [Anaerolineae bacterium]|nr:hypothetical protein [Anaerolineae bacterium]